MAEEVKNQQQDESQEATDSSKEENPSAGGEETPQSGKGNEAKADTAPSDVKSIDPEDQTFWEDSVDANSVDLSEGKTPQGEATNAGESTAVDAEPSEDTPAAEETSQPEAGEQETPPDKTEDSESAPTTPSAEDVEGKDGENDQPAGQEPAAAKQEGQDEAAKSEESPSGDTELIEDTPAIEEASKPEAGEQESPTDKTEDSESAPTTPSPEEKEGNDGEDDQPAAQEPVAAKEAGQEETQADTASEEPQGKGKVISFYKYLRKKRLLTGIGILLLLAGSIGYAVVPGLRSPGTLTSTLLGGTPERAYNMKFFLPLNVGYEKAQFVKVTIALELIDQGLQKELDKNLAHLRKEVIDLILTKSPKEVKSSAGKQELSREITRRINNYLSKDCIKDTYFTELVIL